MYRPAPVIPPFFGSQTLAGGGSCRRLRLFLPSIGGRSHVLQNHARRNGYTLVEILIATVISLLLLGAVVQMFGVVGQTITESRSMLEASDHLRSAQMLLQKDLEGITVTPIPPVRPEDGQGYLEIVEGPIMETRSGVHPNILHNSANPPPPSPYPVPVDRERPPAASGNRVRFPENGQTVTFNVDTSVGDTDDMLLFTTRSKDKPFVGRCGYMADGHTVLDRMVSSDVAEVAWFVRGRTLYRRVLLVAPNALPDPAVVPMPAIPNANDLPPLFIDLDASTFNGFYAFNDLSVHLVPVPGSTTRMRFVGNTLSDLTRRECRFAHPLDRDTSHHPILFPGDVRRWGQLHLPTLMETCDYRWFATLQIPPLAVETFLRQGFPTTDFWFNLPVRSLDLLSNPKDINDPAHPNNPNNVAVRLSNPFIFNLNTVFPSGIYNAPPNAQTKLHKFPPPWDDGGTGSEVILYYPYRVKEEAVLENVIGFDVKVWDAEAPLFLLVNNQVVNPSSPNANPQTVSLNEIPYDPANPTDPLPNPNYVVGRGAYVDLGYWRARYPTFVSPQISNLGDVGDFLSGVSARLNQVPDPTQARIYDTWSTDYENTIYNPNSANPFQYDSSTPELFPGRGTNGFDDPVNGSMNGIVDDESEIHVPPPYKTPLRGIQVKIRIMDPDSRQIREVTVVQDFLPR